jgi:outer membrane protein insertion porin family
MAFHLYGRYIAGYGGRVAPPYSRYYMGGENDVRGFDLWSISPAVYIPTSQTVPIYNNDGTPRTQQVVNSNGQVGTVGAQMTIPTYTIVFPGGDTSAVFNFEYRIPLFGPVTLAPFFDAGMNRISRPDQLQLDPGQVTYLHGLFPQQDFGTKALVVGATQAIRTSTGLEIQVVMPVVNAPFRVYFAYNPNIVRTNLQTPFPAPPAYFPNTTTYNYARQLYGQSFPYDERTTTFRFTIGRTF